jgi:hypothetical protein
LPVWRVLMLMMAVGNGSIHAQPRERTKLGSISPHYVGRGFGEVAVPLSGLGVHVE